MDEVKAAMMAAWGDDRMALRAVERERDALRVENARLREGLAEYSQRDNWWEANHLDVEPDPFAGLTRKVWAWNDHRAPWSMAERILAAGTPRVEGEVNRATLTIDTETLPEWEPVIRNCDHADGAGDDGDGA